MRRVRLCCLRDLDGMLSAFYPLYNERVGASYSLDEERLLVRIVKQITFQIDGSEKCGSASPVVMCAEEGCFRFVLPEKKLFCRASRLQCLLQFDEFITVFFMNYGNDAGLFSYREHVILKRIKKLFVHQLRGTSRYEMFKKKCPPRSSLSEQEKQELLNQQKDERRLKAVCGNIVRYNPLSAKYKALKAETLRKIEQMG